MKCTNKWIYATYKIHFRPLKTPVLTKAVHAVSINLEALEKTLYVLLCSNEQSRYLNTENCKLPFNIHDVIQLIYYHFIQCFKMSVLGRRCNLWQFAFFVVYLQKNNNNMFTKFIFLFNNTQNSRSILKFHWQ